MQHRRELLLRFMVGGLMLFYGTTVAAALTPQEIAKTALGSTVHLGLIDAKGNSWTGSGFVVHDDQVATNHHVIENMSMGGARLVGQEAVYPIQAILVVDKERDLAVIKVTGLDVPALPLGDSDTVQIGDKVYVAGNPQRLEGTFTGGMISAIRPEGIPLVRGKTIQMDAAISPGSSGGPVLNDQGEVIGISVGHRIDGQNLNFAIPINYLKQLVNIPITAPPVKPEPAAPQTDPRPAKPEPVKPKVGPPPAESESTRPQTNPPPVKPKPIKPKIAPPPVESKVTLNSQEIAKIALRSTVHVAIIDGDQENLHGRTGSGFFVRPNQIATNYHVIEDLLIGKGKLVGGAKLVGQEEIYIIEDVIVYNKKRDLAVVKVREAKGRRINVPALSLGDSDTVQIGEKIYVAGNPEGLEGTFSDGIISGIRGDSADKLFQMTAPISLGSSGGPVLNNSGEVIGISVGGMEQGQNLNFAVPVNYLKQLANVPTTPPRVELEPTTPQTDPPSAKPEPVKPEVEPPPAEPESTRPQTNPPPTEPKEVKPQTDPPSVESEPVTPQTAPPSIEPESGITPVDPPRTEPPRPGPRPVMLAKGIKLYEQARYNEAIEVLNSIIQEVENPIHQAEAYLYLGASKRGSGESYDKVKEQFQESIRRNPDQKLPPRVGKDHPIFAELIEEVRKELTGELTVISLLPQTEIWIFGTGTDRKMLGTGIVRSRLLKGNYIVEGSYASGSQRKTVTIELDRHKILNLEIPPIVEHDSPSKISVGERIPLTLDLISSKRPQRVKIYYRTYDRDGSELEPNNQGMRLLDKQSELSTWTYNAGLPSQKHVGSIEYHIKVEYDNHGVFTYPRTQPRYYQISIVDDKAPTISLLDPPKDVKFGANQPIIIRAKVTDNVAVKDVYVHASWFNSQKSKKLTAEGSSDIYTTDIRASNMVVLWYYLTAADEAGNESRSESRPIEIKPGEKPPKEDPSDGDQSGESIDEEEPKDSTDEGQLGELTDDGKPENLADEEEPKGATNENESQDSPIYQGMWASVAADDAFISGSDGSYILRLAYLREGRFQGTLGAQLDFSPDRTNMSAMVQWVPPALGKSDIAFTLLGGIAAYEDSPLSTHTTPIFGGGLKFYPQDKIVIDAIGSFKFRSDYDTTDLYHYEVGIHFYITPELGLRAGYGKLYLGDEDITTVQIGIGVNF